MELTSYERAHLVAHLLAGGRSDDVHRLLCLQTTDRHNQWYEFKAAAGEIASYATDINIAWQAADRVDRLGSSKFRLPIHRQCLYALITATLHSLSGALMKNPDVLLSLVEYHVWAPDQALANVLPMLNRRGADEDAVEALARLAPYLSEEQVSQALAAAYSIDQPYARSRTLAALLPYTRQDQRPTIVTNALAAATEQWNEGGPVGEYSRRFDKNWARAEALTRLLPFLEDSDRVPALEKTLQTIKRTAEGIRGSPDAEDAADRLRQIAPLLPPALLAAAQSIAASIRIEPSRATALAVVAARISDPDARSTAFELAVRSARQADSPDDRALALAGVAAYLGEPQRLELLAEALREMYRIEHEASRSRTLIKLSSSLPAALIDEAISVAQSISDLQSRRLALCAILPLSAGASRHVLVGMVNDLKSRADIGSLTMLTDLLPHVQPTDRPGLVARIVRSLDETTPGPSLRAEVLLKLATHLSGMDSVNRRQLIGEACQAARQLHPDNAPLALAQLLPHVPPSERLALLGEALATAAKANNVSIQLLPLLVEQVVLLPDGERGNALARILASARRIGDRFTFGYAMNAVAFGPRDRTNSAAAPDHPIDDNGQPVSAAEVLEAASAHELTSYKIRAIEPMLPRLSERERLEVVAQMLPVVREETGRSSRAWALARLALELPLDERLPVLAEAADDARKAPGTQGAVREDLKMLAEGLRQLPTDTLYPIWTGLLHALAERQRPELAVGLSALAPVIHQLADEQMTREIAQLADRVTAWWP